MLPYLLVFLFAGRGQAFAVNAAGERETASSFASEAGGRSEAATSWAVVKTTGCSAMVVQPRPPTVWLAAVPVLYGWRGMRASE